MASPELKTYFKDGVGAALFGEAERLDIPQEDKEFVYNTAARAVAKARYAARRQANFDIHTWRPTPDELPELQPFAQQLALIRNVDEFVAACERGDEELGLKDYQVPVFHDFVAALHENTPDNLRGRQELVDVLTKGLYARLSCNWGKTVLFAKTALALGIGKSSEVVPGERLRGVFLVPRAITTKQAQGHVAHKDYDIDKLLELDSLKLAKGFAAHAPSIKTTVRKVKPEKNEDDSDLVIMTYDAFATAVEKGTIDPQKFNALLLDETHHGLGERVAEAIAKFRRGKICLGLTATVENTAKHVEDILPHGFHFTNDLELIESGVHSAQQYFAIKTGQKIATLTKGLDFSDQELREIRKSEQRNKLIVQLASEMVAKGRSGFIPCLPGEDSDHAQFICQELNQTRVPCPTPEDPHATRLIKAVAIGSFNSPSANSAILEAWERGEYDVLTGTDMLTESIDSNRVGFLLLATPTASSRVAIQRLGRAYRQNKWGLSVIIELIDEVEPLKNQSYTRLPFTALHALEIDEYSPGMILGAPEFRKKAEKQIAREAMRRRHSSHATEDSERSQPMDQPLTENDEASIISPFFMEETFDGVIRASDEYLVREILLRQLETIPPPPDNWIPIPISVLAKKGMDLRMCRNVIGKTPALGGESHIKLCRRPARYARTMNYISPEAWEVLQNFEIGDKAPENYRTFHQAAVSLGLTDHMFQEVFNTLNDERRAADLPEITALPYRTLKQNRLFPHISDEDVALVKARYDQYPKIGPDDIRISQIAEMCEVSSGSIVEFYKKHNIPVTKKYGSKTTPPLVVDRKNLQNALDHFVRNRIPEHAITIPSLSHETNLSSALLCSLVVNCLHLPPETIKRGRQKNTEGKVWVDYLEDEEVIEKLRAYKDMLSLKKYSISRGIPLSNLNRDLQNIIATKGIAPLKIKLSTYLLPHDIAQIDEYYGLLVRPLPAKNRRRQQDVITIKDIAPEPSLPKTWKPSAADKAVQVEVAYIQPKAPVVKAPSLPSPSPRPSPRPRRLYAPPSPPPLAPTHKETTSTPNYDSWKDYAEALDDMGATNSAMQHLIRQLPQAARYLRKVAADKNTTEHIQMAPALYNHLRAACRRLKEPRFGWVYEDRARQLIIREGLDPAQILPQVHREPCKTRVQGVRRIDMYYDLSSIHAVIKQGRK